MQVALIPPRGMERTIFGTRMQMTLANVDYTLYNSTFVSASERGDHVILDNGAAELARGQSPFSNRQLLHIARRRQATELVLPDALHNKNKTLNAVKWFFTQLDHAPLDVFANELSYMGVVQGANLGDIQTCVQTYAENPRIHTIGIPRLHITPEYRAIRIDAANWIEREFPLRFRIHLLGTSPQWVKEVQLAARYAPHIRSVDTSLPFNYSIEGFALDMPKPPIVMRPARYFEEDKLCNMHLLRRNINTLLGWANAETRTG